MSLAIAFITSLLLIASCTYENAETRFPKGNINCDTVSFSKHIKPIIETQCALNNCHNANSKNGDFTTYNLMSTKISKFSNRLLVLQDMPQNSSLTPTERELFDCWLQKGGPNN